jgi:hypothetical protein
MDSAHAGFDGRSRLPKRYAGHLELPEDVPLHVSAVLRTAVLATERVQAGQPEVKLVVPLDTVLASLCSVRLRIVDGTTGEPIPGARVGLSDAQRSGGGQPVDAEGRIEMVHQRPGLLNLDVTAKQRAAASWNVELAPGVAVDLGDVPLLPPVDLKLELAGCEVGTEISLSLRTLERPPHPALRPRLVHYGNPRDGRFSAPVAPGRYLLRAAGGGRVAVLAIDTRALNMEPLVVRLQPDAKLRLVPPGAGRAVEVTILDHSGRSMWHRWINAAQPFEVSLPPGHYAAEIVTPEGRKHRHAIALPPAGAELDLR